MPPRPPSFAPPPDPTPRRRRCLFRLAAASLMLLVGTGAYAGHHALSPATRPSRLVSALSTAAGPDGAACRRAWGAIRARYRLKQLVVPA